MGPDTADTKAVTVEDLVAGKMHTRSPRRDMGHRPESLGRRRLAVVV
jgi:hypothetical protein